MDAERSASWPQDFLYTGGLEGHTHKVKDRCSSCHQSCGFQQILEISLPRNIACIHISQQDR